MVDKFWKKTKGKSKGISSLIKPGHILLSELFFLLALLEGKVSLMK